MEILFDIAIILIVAKVFGEIAERMRFSSLVGEVIAGIAVGPLLGLVHPSTFLGQIANLGVVFLMFLIGLGTKFDDFKRDIYKGSLLAVAGAALSAVLGFMIGSYVFNNFYAGLVIGAALVSTSTAVSLRSLIDIGEFRTNVYNKITMILTADDVVAILTLALMTSYFTFSVEIWKVAALFFAVIGFFFLVLTAGSRFVPKVLDLFSKLPDEQIMLSIPLVIVFIIAFASENVGIAAVTGAFLTGMAMNRSNLAESTIAPKVKTIGYGFFIPIFFAYSALILDLSALGTHIWLILLLVVIAALGKFIGAGLLSRVYGLNLREQITIGIGMIPRGEYTIIVAQAALAAAMLTTDIYTIIVAFVLVSIIITPLLLRIVGKAK
jgi:Kef-type K+ transport system membrane component KefB